MNHHLSFPELIPALILAWIVLPGPVSAQTDAEINAGIQFDFSTPGARSLAMGGAFIGLADDATAAFANPAGLLELDQSQVSIEGRAFRLTHSFTDRGHAFGFVSGAGIDAIEGLRSAEAGNDVAGVSFLSYVHPWKDGDGQTRWMLALYRHQLLNFEADFRTQGALFDFFDAAGNRQTRRLLPVIAALDAEIVNYGVSAAYRLSDELRIGLGVSFYDFEIASLQQRFAVAADPASFFGLPDYAPANEREFQEQVGNDQDFGIQAGLLWKLSEVWQLGAVYRQGPGFEVDTANRSGGFLEARFGVPRGTPSAEQKGRFNVPDVLGLGLAFLPSDAIRVTFDYNRIDYSVLTAGLISIFETPEFLSATERAALDALAVDDGDVYRLGFEYSFRGLRCPGSTTKNCAIALRLGAWHDPDHKVRFATEPGLDVDTRAQAIQFLGGEDEHHFAAGLGVALGQRIRIDLGADFSDAVDTASLSTVFYFGG